MKSVTTKNIRHVFADVRLTGSSTEINQTLEFLANSGCKWESDGKYYKWRSSEKQQSSYYLRKFRGPINYKLNADEPQPRPGDMVLGGKKRQLNDA